MLFRKGELVEVTNSLDEGMKDFVGKVGKIEKVNDIDRDEAPFLVSFFSNGQKEKGLFSHTELRLANGTEDDRKRQCHYNEARLYRMQKKI